LVAKKPRPALSVAPDPSMHRIADVQLLDRLQSAWPEWSIVANVWLTR
jgi:hypothetical protein